MRGEKDVETAKNIHKREMAAEQLVAHIKDTVNVSIPTIKTIVVGGDFNTNKDQESFANERTFDTLTDFGFSNAWAGIPLEKRITHPGGHGYPDCTFDWFFTWGGGVATPVITPSSASDHLPVTVEIELK